VQLVGEATPDYEADGEATAVFTGEAGIAPALREALAARGLRHVNLEAHPLP
jgi:hypothetical protein